MSKIVKIVNEIKPDTNYLSTYYHSLPLGSYCKVRDMIIAKCHISHVTFYNWIKGKNEVPETTQYIINHITGVEVFPGKKLN